MKKLIVLLIMSLTLSAYTQVTDKTYYIDPTSKAIGTPNGTIEHPYLSWDNVKWTAGSIYLQKRGTENVVTKVLKPAVSNITLGAYGTGARPIIKTTVGDRAKGVEIKGANIIIKDLEIYSTNAIVCAIILGGEGPFLIDNCVLHHCEWGIRAFDLTGKLTLSNTEIYSTGDDGVYTEDTEDIEIFGCYIHHVNSDLPDRVTAGGDCIQITGAQGYLNIHDNILDHSAFGAKFCLIIGSAIDGTDEPSEALVERNTMIGNQSSVFTSGVYLKESISNLIFRYNTVKDAATGLWMNANTTVHNNTFIRCWQGVTVNADKTAKLYNNTFVNNETGIKANYGSTNYIYNNIFHSGTMTKEHYSLNGTITSDYNCFDANGAGFYGGGANTLTEVQTKRNRDMHSFVANPLFVNIPQDDYHLTEKSPCINKGKVLSEVTKDKDGVIIAKGTLPDIGAYEHSNTPVTDPVPCTETTYDTVYTVIEVPTPNYYLVPKDTLIIRYENWYKLPFSIDSVMNKIINEYEKNNQIIIH